MAVISFSCFLGKNLGPKIKKIINDNPSLILVKLSKFHCRLVEKNVIGIEVPFNKIKKLTVTCFHSV